MLVLLPFLAGFAFPAAAVTDARVSETYGKLPLHFETNRGQTDKDVRFLSRGAGYSLYLTAGEAVVVLAKPKPDVKRDAGNVPENRDAKAPVKSVALRMSLVGAARKPVVSELEEQAGKANYFIGKDPAKWRTNVPTYAKVHYQNVYPGIDLLYYGNQRQLEYDFVVAPGADPKKIALDFKGANKLQIDAGGDLVLHTAGGDIRLHKPVIYQEIAGVRRDIDGGYVRKGANRIGFKIAAYDTSRPLIIDPVLSYSTYVGGGLDEIGMGIAVDAAGHVYVTGRTSSTDFPTTSGAFQPANSGTSSYDAFVMKLDPTGSTLVYSTYLGGSLDDIGARIVLDAAGNTYVLGNTSSANFPTTPGVFQPAHVGGSDAFVAKLDSTGSLIYSTYLGGSDNDGASGLAVDAGGNAYVVGITRSLDFPTTPGAFQQTIAGGAWDGFVMKLNPTATALVYSTYLGASGVDSVGGIAVDAAANAYVTGITGSTDFPTTFGAFQPVYAGGVTDAFVTKLNPAGSALIYSTYLGGTGLYPNRAEVFPFGFDGQEGGSSIAIDAGGNAYVAGGTTSIDFPTTPGAFQPVFISPGGDPGIFKTHFNSFVTKLNPTGSALVYSTYLGGSGEDGIGGIVVDDLGNLYMAGATSSPDFPVTPDAIQPAFHGGDSFPNDAFVAILNPVGSALVYSTFLGGRNNDQAVGIALDLGGNIYVAGRTNSFDFPTTPGTLQPAFTGGNFDYPFFPHDAFVVKIAP
jgi:hypothetical protein